VNGVDFSVSPGSVMTMLGPSGCGKTTILRCIAGLENATDGEIIIGDRRVFSGGVSLVPIEDRNLGMVFQSYAIWPHMTIAANVAYGLKVRGRPKTEIKRRVNEALELVRLEGFGDRYPSQLSGGQMQRVVLARAIAYNPDILLLDEPLANLDAHLREEMRLELKRIQRETGTTMVAVTHDQSEALAISDQILVMSSGKVLQRGSPREIWASPVVAPVARFLGGANELRLRSEGGLAVIDDLGPMPHGSPSFTAANGVAIFRASDARISAPGSGGWRGKILLSQYLGGHIHYLVRCAQYEFAVEMSPSGPLFKEGDEVDVIVPGEAIMTFDEVSA